MGSRQSCLVNGGLCEEDQDETFTSDWDLNPCGQDSNTAKSYGIWFQDLMKLRLMSHLRKNSVKDKVIGKKWINLERKARHRQNVGHHRE